MAIIALAGNTIDCCIGTYSFEGVGTAFSSAKQSVKLPTQQHQLAGIQQLSFESFL